ncbi:hypothetical protein [Vibrio parahaemolyticus]|uniref:hypothetical protein n=1 Tax=Vibrio parahaemolyticus TaxID=670 RepID=UPI00112264E3|nr:hypothetical protein [Vibrio parahaemolyticus]ELA8132730.1 hypothetical protein [Vibrio parahaemolyticus]TOK52040.1 hypothetical protein CGI17_21515 [Vibrio parahaemolyticus]TOK79224.1 hypothetical protein CGI11_17090 [Vibrio parahaemolyticus]TOK80330.1 hypothetical protein CGI10_23875 [Vibrio parahaemolyticus]HBI3715847.1 hypothetical protein [Vibrio parahaemolyticus]
MKFINIGEGAKVDGLQLKRNILVTDDMSQVVFVDVGKNGEVINLDANGNQVLTPEAYSKYLDARVSELDDCFSEFTEELHKIENEIAKAKINRQLNAVKEELKQVVPQNSTINYSRALNTLKDLCINLGYGVLAGIATSQLGF